MVAQNFLYFHVLNRGVEKRITFNNDSDYKRFLLLMYYANSLETVTIRNFTKMHKNYESLFNREHSDSLVEIISYCLMPNHFHFLIKTDSSDKLGKFLQKLQTGYVMYFNKKYERTGSLWQGKPKKKLVQNDLYLQRLYYYIHANPLELFNPLGKEDLSTALSLVDKLDEFPYSSHTKNSDYSWIATKIITKDPLFNMMDILDTKTKIKNSFFHMHM